MFFSSASGVSEHLFELKFAAKQLEKSAQRCEKQEKVEKDKLTAAIKKRVTSSMSGVVKAMESAMKTMNLEKVQQLMDRFERDFENLDVHTATMERTMDGTTVLNAPKSQVDALIAEAADKAG
ncbi:unnamed protein product [Angiostrongylus costaricensis]|uniref:Charged multivesicular body protein 1a n=1 Tax=Angiostrongylus costaricensis TaxID=334426 RepID=A0A0R3PZ46_ANGCS|nr:unnamed protein product [Angiostrongylus costaricensis]